MTAAGGEKSVTLVGGGLAGALMALHLSGAGYRVAVYERREDIRKAAVVHGRSINLAVSTRGIHALRQAGLADAVLAQAIPMRGRMIHARSGELAFQPYGKDETECIYSVSRTELNRILLDAAGKNPSVSLHFDERCVDVDVETGEVELEHTTSGQHRRVRGDFVIGADGAFSAVRGRLTRLDRFTYSQEYLDYGYKELTIPPAADGGFRLPKNALHIWPRRSFMMIALPNLDGSFTCTLFWPLDGPHGFSSLRTEGDVREYFAKWFPDAVPHLPTLAADYLAAPASTLVTIRCFPWSVRNKVVLLGDACHAVVPFYGQGMNAAFQDCTVLGECLARHAPDYEKAFKAYETQRKPDVDALAELALENFVEMRDHTGSRRFLLKKRIEKTLHKWFPRLYIPLYTLVTFTLTPYAKARRRARCQTRVVGAVVVLIVAALVAAILWLVSSLS